MEGLLQTTGKTFTEFGWLLPESDQEFAREAIRSAKRTFEGSDQDEEAIDFKRLMQDLEQTASLLTQAMFSSQAHSSGDKMKTPPPQEADPLYSWMKDPSGTGKK